MITKKKQPLKTICYKKFKRITNTKLRRQDGNLKKNSGRDGIIQIAKTLFSLWSLVKKMDTETRAQNIKAGEVVTYYNYLGKATLKFGTGPVKKSS